MLQVEICGIDFTAHSHELWLRAECIVEMK